MSTLLEMTTDIAGPNIGAFFDMMGAAEEEIATAKEQLPPDDADTIHDAFRLLMPTPPLSTDRLYRAHCQQTIARLVAAEDTRPGTDAEILGAMMATSLRAPLTSQGQRFYQRTFARCFPDEECASDPMPGVFYSGSDEAAARAARRELALAWRA